MTDTILTQQASLTLWGVRGTPRMCQTLTTQARCDGDGRTRRKTRPLTTPLYIKKNPSPPQQRIYERRA